LLLHGLVPVPSEEAALKNDLKGVRIAATGDPQKPVWTLRREKGEGQVCSGDVVTLESGNQCFCICDGWAYALEKLKTNSQEEAVDSSFIIEIKAYPPPMRIGFIASLMEGFEDVEWFGRGPHESYLDRHASARVGVFQGRIVDQTFKYVRPQENGNKHDTRWMALKRSGGKDAGCAGLLLAAKNSSPQLGMQCHRIAIKDFDGGENKAAQKPLHGGELEEQLETDICIDVVQMGVGGIDSWGRRPCPQHMIESTQEFDWSFQLHPLSLEEVQAGTKIFSVVARGNAC